ncbi:MAG: signal peptidase II [Dethiobacter sp.]|jgi:signal peptidase II|nr:MAG: signal peptidase II [Dethiobacter sp.]
MRRRKTILRGEKNIEAGKTAFSFPCTLIKGDWLKKLRFSSTAFFVVALLVILTDQLSKLWVLRKFAPGETWALIPNIFHLTYVRNPGAAFGILAYKTPFFIAISVLAIFLIVFSGHFLDSRYALFRLALALQLGGAMGNLIDRLRTGYVIDFLDFRFWPVFNLADTAIVLGIVLLFLSLWCNTTIFSGSKR